MLIHYTGSLFSSQHSGSFLCHDIASRSASRSFLLLARRTTFASLSDHLAENFPHFWFILCILPLFFLQLLTLGEQFVQKRSISQHARRITFCWSSVLCATPSYPTRFCVSSLVIVDVSCFHVSVGVCIAFSVFCRHQN